MERPEIERRLREFIADELLGQRYDGRDPLAARLVDSLELEQIVTYIEDEFGVKLSDEEMVEQTFASIPVLAALVERKLEQARA